MDNRSFIAAVATAAGAATVAITASVAAHALISDHLAVHACRRAAVLNQLPPVRCPQ